MEKLNSTKIIYQTQLVKNVFKLNTSDIICHLVKPEPQFPDDSFTNEQRKSGAILLHVLAFIYAVILAEHVCNEYFMPAIGYLSFEKLKLSPHIAGATLISASSSLTEVFTSISGVLMAKNDISIFILMGAGAFNLLVVVGLCCFFVYKLDFKLKIYPILRDSFFYSINLTMIFLFLYKNNFNKLFWYDSLIGMCFYYLFMLVNIFDERAIKWFKQFFQSLFIRLADAKYNNGEIQVEMIDPNVNNLDAISSVRNKVRFITPIKHDLIVRSRERELDFDKSSSVLSLGSKSSHCEDYEDPYDLVKPYKHFSNQNNFRKIKLCFVLPVRLIAFVTVLDFRRFEKNKNFVLVITLVSSALVIALCSYILVWMSLIFCETFQISETIVGFLLVAAAISIEETIKSVKICKKELSKFRSNRSVVSNDKNRLNMVVSNCIGCNIFNLTMGLSLPYLLNSLFFSNKRFFSNVYSNNNLSVLILGLICCLILFIILLLLSKFRLTRNFGFSVLSIWFIYVLIIILIELDLIELFKSNYEIKRC